MDQDVVLRGGMVNIVPSPTGVFAPEDLAINTGSGVVIPKVSGEPNPTIQIQLTEGSPVNVVLITLYGKKYDNSFLYLFIYCTSIAPCLICIKYHSMAPMHE